MSCLLAPVTVIKVLFQWNSTKIELYNELLSENMEKDERLEYMFPIIRFHSRWSDITEKDITGNKGFLKGARMAKETFSENAKKST